MTETSIPGMKRPSDRNCSTIIIDDLNSTGLTDSRPWGISANQVGHAALNADTCTRGLNRARVMEAGTSVLI
jgi:hypothetical protein